MGKDNKTPPVHKQVPGTNFIVDGFNYFAPETRDWFLTHFHSDHYYGLYSSFSKGTIYCSTITKRLCIEKLRVKPWRIREINPGETISIRSLQVTAFDANHCPGSCFFLFEVPGKGRFLHSGDFRYTPLMQRYRELSEIDVLYLDTTYCDPKHRFPTQDEMALWIAQETKKALRNPDVAIAIGTYLIGKERVLLRVWEECQHPICVTPDKMQILRLLDLPCDFNQVFTLDSRISRIHVVPLGYLSFNGIASLKKRLQGFSEIVGFSPTGWSFSGKSTISSQSFGSVTIFGVPYSEHSSFEELKEFVSFIRPKKIIPTVNVDKSGRLDKMLSHFHHIVSAPENKGNLFGYFQKSSFQSDESNASTVEIEQECMIVESSTSDLASKWCRRISSSSKKSTSPILKYFIKKT
jgi:DNA cross-link repair 1A protein